MLDAKIASALNKYHPEFPVQEGGQCRGTESPERGPASSRKTDTSPRELRHVGCVGGFEWNDPPREEMERIGRESQQIAREQLARPDMTRWERPDKPRHHKISTSQNEDVGMEPHGARQDNDVEERQLCQMELWRQIPWDVLHDPGATRDAARQRSEERWQSSEETWQQSARQDPETTKNCCWRSCSLTECCSPRREQSEEDQPEKRAHEYWHEESEQPGAERGACYVMGRRKRLKAICHALADVDMRAMRCIDGKLELASDANTCFLSNILSEGSEAAVDNAEGIT